jgi:uncharacterized protein YdaT
MTKTKHKKKPGIKDVITVINSMIQEFQQMRYELDSLYGTIDMYIEHKGDTEGFKAYLDDKLKEQQENEAKRDEPIDAEYTEADTED